MKIIMDTHAVGNYFISLVAIFIAATGAGFSLLKAYEAFQIGVAKKSKLRIWSAFVIVSFVFLLFTFTIVRTTKYSV